MSLSNEDLLSISKLLDMKLQPIKDEMKMIRTDILENNVIPRLSTIEIMRAQSHWLQTMG